MKPCPSPIVKAAILLEFERRANQHANNRSRFSPLPPTSQEESEKEAWELEDEVLDSGATAIPNPKPDKAPKRKTV
jgi:hypothetical protein